MSSEASVVRQLFLYLSLRQATWLAEGLSLSLSTTDHLVEKLVAGNPPASLGLLSLTPLQWGH